MVEVPPSQATPADGDAATAIAPSGPTEKRGAAMAGARDDWRAMIGDDQVRAFAERFASPAEMARAAFEFRQKLSGAVPRPGKNANASEIAAFRRSLGVPDTADGYAVRLPGDAPLEDAAAQRLVQFKTAMHAAGAPPTTVQAAVNAFFAMNDEAEAAQAAADKRHLDASTAALQRKWAPDYARNLALANRAIDDVSDQTVAKLELRDGSQLGNYAPFVEMMARVGRAMVEDTFYSPETGDGAESIRERIDRITEATMADGSYTSEAVQQQPTPLYRELYGDGPIVGTDGRTA